MDKKTVCIDLDGVLAHYDGWKGVEHIGDPLPGAKELVAQLAKKYKVVLWTTRANLHVNLEELDRLVNTKFPDALNAEEVAWILIDHWLRKHKFPRAWAGEEGGIDRVTHMKVPAVAFIDDRAIGVSKNLDWTDHRERMTRNEILDQVDRLAER